MNRKALSPLIVFLLIAFLLRVSTTVFALPEENRPFQQSTLPQITFLGQGPQTFTVEPPLKFLVKTYQSGQFLFVADDGPTYAADRNERVWTIDVVPTESIRLFDEFRSYGNVEAGCVVNYVQIEDNVDTRRNTFFINGNPLQVVEQGMVTYGTFTVPEAGELTFFAEDSIGMVIELCQNVQTAVPSETPPVVTTTTATATQTATSELIILTPTTAPSSTPLAPTEETPLPSQTPTTAATSTSTAPAIELTPEPSETPLTATSTTAPTSQTPSPTAQTVQLTATPTSQVSQNTPTRTAQVVLVTATPLSTSSALPVTGGEPGPREIALISLTLIGLFLLVGAAWWFLIRAYAQRR